MTFELSFYLKLRWKDPRLAQNESLNEITSNIHPGDVIWIPDIYIVNVREVTYFSKFTRTVINSGGNVFYSEKILAKCTCEMDLSNYPMDTQKCGVQIESYAFSKQNLRLNWSPIAIPRDFKIPLTGYILKDETKSKHDVFYGKGVDFRFEQLILNFHVKRTSVYYIYKGYLPTIALTIFNLCSYWVPDNALPARISLIITTFLANMFILQSVTDQTVKVSYTTAMQLFLLVNIMFLMTSIIQYLAILNLKRRSTQKHQKSVVTEGGIMAKNPHTNNDACDVISQNNKSSFKTHLEMIEQVLLVNVKSNNVHIFDSVFRVMMPLLYLIFCTVYFSYYLR